MGPLTYPVSEVVASATSVSLILSAVLTPAFKKAPDEASLAFGNDAVSTIPGLTLLTTMP